jgi:hypothetical protein
VADVILDGVAVQFSGPAPASVAAVHGLLEQVLAEQGRVLAGLWIDGQPFDENHAAMACATIVRIEARSVTLAAALAEIAAGLRPELRAALQPGRELAHEVVRVPWTEIQRSPGWWNAGCTSCKLAMRPRSPCCSMRICREHLTR